MFMLSTAQFAARMILPNSQLHCPLTVHWQCNAVQLFMLSTAQFAARMILPNGQLHCPLTVHWQCNAVQLFMLSTAQFAARMILPNGQLHCPLTVHWQCNAVQLFAMKLQPADSTVHNIATARSGMFRRGKNMTICYSQLTVFCGVTERRSCTINHITEGSWIWRIELLQ